MCALTHTYTYYTYIIHTQRGYGKAWNQQSKQYLCSSFWVLSLWIMTLQVDERNTAWNTEAFSFAKMEDSMICLAKTTDQYPLKPFHVKVHQCLSTCTFISQSSSVTSGCPVRYPAWPEEVVSASIRNDEHLFTIVYSLVSFQKLKSLPDGLLFQFPSCLLFVHLSTFSSFPTEHVTVRF